jgi:hypothetical protein
MNPYQERPRGNALFQVFALSQCSLKIAQVRLRGIKAGERQNVNVSEGSRGDILTRFFRAKKWTQGLSPGRSPDIPELGMQSRERSPIGNVPRRGARCSHGGLEKRVDDNIKGMCSLLMAHSFAHVPGTSAAPPGRGVMFGRIPGVSPRSQGQCPSGAPFRGRYLYLAKSIGSPHETTTEADNRPAGFADWAAIIRARA